MSAAVVEAGDWKIVIERYRLFDWRYFISDGEGSAFGYTRTRRSAVVAAMAWGRRHGMRPVAP